MFPNPQTLSDERVQAGIASEAGAEVSKRMIGLQDEIISCICNTIFVIELRLCIFIIYSIFFRINI